MLQISLSLSGVQHYDYLRLSSHFRAGSHHQWPVAYQSLAAGVLIGWGV